MNVLKVENICNISTNTSENILLTNQTPENNEKRNLENIFTK